MRRTALGFLCLPALVAQAPSAYDTLLAPYFAADQAGASVLVMKEGKVVGIITKADLFKIAKS